ncbi:hypothetical protein KAN5_04260 [Pseudoalteromonas sp. KAN5]|nr:hypothetical protein KAN5_04260 [Pseudoalteromonas sp. KAN5]
MNLDQFFITFILALLLGIVLSQVGKGMFVYLVRYYRKLTFRHVVLIPYSPKKVKKDSK